MTSDDLSDSSDSDSEYFTADEEEGGAKKRVELRLCDVQGFYEFTYLDGTVWLLPKYYGPQNELLGPQN